MWFIQSQSQRPAGSKTGRRGHSTSRLPAHRFDESPDDYSLASCSPAELASASPSASQLALDLPAERSLTIKRQVVHICRVSPMGGSPVQNSGTLHKKAQRSAGRFRTRQTFRASRGASEHANIHRQLTPPPPGSVRSFACANRGILHKNAQRSGLAPNQSVASGLAAPPSRRVRFFPMPKPRISAPECTNSRPESRAPNPAIGFVPQTPQRRSPSRRITSWHKPIRRRPQSGHIPARPPRVAYNSKL